MSASSKSQPSSSNQHTSAVATWQQVAIFMAIYIGYGGYYILRKAFPSVVSFVLNDDDMTFTLQHAGALTSAMAMMYGVGKLVFGVAADNFDPLLVMFFPLLAASYVSQLHTSINQSCSITCNYARSHATMLTMLPLALALHRVDLLLQQQSGQYHVWAFVLVLLIVSVLVTEWLLSRFSLGMVCSRSALATTTTCINVSTQ
jgi:hypothetical protein